jgi:hypothetical protein
MIPRIQSESNFELMKGYAPGERDLIKSRLEKAWRTKYGK